MAAHSFDAGKSCASHDIDYGLAIARCTVCGMRWSLGPKGWAPIGRPVSISPTIRRGLFE